MLLGNSPNCGVVYMKPDRIGLWIYKLYVKLNNKALYMLDLWLHDAISVLGESIPVSRVVRHWREVVHSFNVARMADTILVFNSYCLDDAAREGLAAKNVKFIGAVYPQRFLTLTRVAEGIWAKRGSSVRLPLDVRCKTLLCLL